MEIDCYHFIEQFEIELKRIRLKNNNYLCLRHFNENVGIVSTPTQLLPFTGSTTLAQ